MKSPSLPEKLSIDELQLKLKECVRITKEQMAPLLYYLRLKLKKQGSRTGEGFGAWVEANLQFTRRTADLWADEYGLSQGLMEPRTSRKISKGLVPHQPKDDDLFPLELAFGPEERRAFLEATEILGLRKTQKVIYEAVLTAAAKRRKPNAKAIDTTWMENRSSASAPRRTAASA